MTTAIVQDWVDRCLQNLSVFEGKREEMSITDQITFVRNQYEVLGTVVKVSLGTTRLQGINHRAIIRRNPQ